MLEQPQHWGERGLWEVTVEEADGRIEHGSVLATKAETVALRELLLAVVPGRGVTMTRGDVPTAHEFLLYSPMMSHEEPVFSVDAIVAFATRAAEIAGQAETARDASSSYEAELLRRAQELQQEVDRAFDAVFAKDDRARK